MAPKESAFERHKKLLRDACDKVEAANAALQGGNIPAYSKLMKEANQLTTAAVALNDESIAEITRKYNSDNAGPSP